MLLPSDTVVTFASIRDNHGCHFRLFFVVTVSALLRTVTHGHARLSPSGCQVQMLLRSATKWHALSPSNSVTTIGHGCHRVHVKNFHIWSSTVSFCSLGRSHLLCTLWIRWECMNYVLLTHTVAHLGSRHSRWPGHTQRLPGCIAPCYCRSLTPHCSPRNPARLCMRGETLHSRWLHRTAWSRRRTTLLHTRRLLRCLLIL